MQHVTIVIKYSSVNGRAYIKIKLLLILTSRYIPTIS
jgi:hypothetical protein